MKPLSPLCTVQMSDTKDSPVPVPLLAADLLADVRSVMLAYGNHLQPAMERVVSRVEIQLHITCWLSTVRKKQPPVIIRSTSLKG